MICIFLHGLGQRAASWERTLSRMTHREELLCPELKEFLTGDKTYSSLYRAFCAYCEGIEAPFALCGLSLGAVLALHYTIEYPERVGKLALIAPQYKMPRALLKLQNIILRWMPRRMFQGNGFTKQDFLSLTASMETLDFRRELARLACPVLILCGERDGANRKAAGRLAKRLVNARLCLVPGAGHEVNLDEPEKLEEILTAFL